MSYVNLGYLWSWFWQYTDNGENSLSESYLVELSAIAASGQDNVGNEMKSFAELLKPYPHVFLLVIKSSVNLFLSLTSNSESCTSKKLMVDDGILYISHKFYMKIHFCPAATDFLAFIACTTIFCSSIRNARTILQKNKFSCSLQLKCYIPLS